jgi:hypothetical protein
VKKYSFSEEKIISILKEGEAGAKVAAWVGKMLRNRGRGWGKGSAQRRSKKSQAW